MARRRWNGAEIAILEQYSLAGPTRLAQQLSRSEDSVSSMARRMGLRANPSRRKSQQARVESSSSVNAHFFDNHAAEVAYVLGVVWSCGTIRLAPRKVLILDCPDARQAVLHSARNLMGSCHKLQWRPGRIRLEVCNSFLVQSLIQNFGHPPMRANPASLPRDVLPYLEHFARGMLDATGNEGENKLTWSGPRELINELQQQIRAKTGLTGPLIEHDGWLATISWRLPEQVHILRTWLPSTPNLQAETADPLLAG